MKDILLLKKNASKIIFLLSVFFLFFFYVQFSFATFSLSGTTITQSGTDTDLSGLQSIANVTVTVIGGLTIYDLSNVALRIDGELSINAKTEKIINPTQTRNKIYGEGKIIINDFQELNGVRVYSYNLAIEDQHASTWGHRFGSSGDGGFQAFPSLEMNGGAILIGGATNFKTVTAVDGKLTSRHRGSGQNYQISIAGDSVITSLTTERVSINLNSEVDYSGLSIQGNDGNRYSVFGGAILVNPDIDPNISHLIRADSIKNIRMVNNRLGSGSLTIGTRYTTGNLNGITRDLEVTKQLSFDIVDLQGGDVENAKIYIPDYDNDKRVDVSSFAESDFEEQKTKEDYQENFDRTNYLFETDVNGGTDTQEILLMNWNGYYQSTQADSPSVGNNNANTQNGFKDFRGKNGDDTDVFDVFIWAYNYLPEEFEISLSGNEEYVVNRTLFRDLSITEEDVSIVSSYNIDIDHDEQTITIPSGEEFNINDLYDYIKYDKTFDENIEFPELNTLAMTSVDGKIFKTTYRIIINGTLNHDPKEVVLEIIYQGENPSMIINNDGVYNYGTETIILGQTILSTETGLIVVGADTVENAEWKQLKYGSIQVNGGGTWNSNGGVVKSDRGFGIGIYEDTSIPIINIKETIFTKEGTTSRRELRFDTDGEISGSFTGETNGFQISHRAIPTIFSPVISNGQLVQLADGPATSNISNIDTGSNINVQTDLGIDDLRGGPRFYLVKNAVKGSGIRTSPKSGVGDTRQTGGSIISKEVSFNIKSNNGDNLESVSVFTRDTDNGFRKNANSQDHLVDKTYFSTTDSTGNTPILEIVTAITNIDSEGSFVYTDWDTTNHNNRYKVDRRGKDDTTNDDFDFYFWEYNSLPAQTKVSLKGNDILNIDWTLFADESVSETTSSVVSSYPVIDTLDKLYDRAKLWKTLNETNIIIPSQSEYLITANGTEIILPIDWKLEINSTATEVFNVNETTKTITIKANSLIVGSKFTSVKAQGLGTVTSVNNENLDVSISDANGDSATVLTGAGNGQIIGIYTTATNANTSTDPVETITSNTNGEATYRYSGDNTTIYFKTEATNTNSNSAIRDYVKVTGTGNILDMSVGGTLSAVNNTLNIVRDQTLKTIYVDSSNTGSEDGSALFPFNTISEAKNSTEARKLKNITILSDETLDVDLVGYIVSSPNSSTLDLNGQNVLETKFIGVTITGTINGTIYSEKSILRNVTNLDGHHVNTGISGIVIPSANATLTLIKPFSDIPGLGRPTLNLNGNTDVDIAIRDYSGGLNITNSTNIGNEITIGGTDFKLTIDSTNTAGVISVRGVGFLVDESNGATIDIEALIKTNIFDKILKKLQAIFVATFI